MLLVDWSLDTMSRNWLGTTLRAVAREAARAERSRQVIASRERAVNSAAVKESAARQKEAARAEAVARSSADKSSKTAAKEAARAYVAARMEEAADRTKDIRARELAISTLLTDALKKIRH